MDPAQEAKRKRRANLMLLGTVVAALIIFGVVLRNDIIMIFGGVPAHKDRSTMLLGYGFSRDSTSPSSSPWLDPPSRISLTQYAAGGIPTQRINLVASDDGEWHFDPSGHIAHQPTVQQMLDTLFAVRTDRLPLADSEEQAAALGITPGSLGTIRLELTPRMDSYKPLALIVLGDLVRRADSPKVWRMAARHVPDLQDSNWLARTVSPIAKDKLGNLTKITLTGPGSSHIWTIERTDLAGDLAHSGWRMTHPVDSEIDRARIASLLMYASELPIRGRYTNTNEPELPWQLQLTGAGIDLTIWVGRETMVLADQPFQPMVRSNRIPFRFGDKDAPLYYIGPTQAAELLPHLSRLTGVGRAPAGHWPGSDPSVSDPSGSDTPQELRDPPATQNLTGVQVIVVFARGYSFSGAGPTLRTLPEAVEIAQQALAQLKSGAEFGAIAEQLSDWRTTPSSPVTTELRQHPADQPPPEVLVAIRELAPGQLHPDPIVADDGVYLIRRIPK